MCIDRAHSRRRRRTQRADILGSVRENSEKNLMSARNLGLVFGPTLVQSRDPGAEFSDMAGKALSVEWLVENAQRIFTTQNAAAR
jgi:hypothetical protein